MADGVGFSARLVKGDVVLTKWSRCYRALRSNGSKSTELSEILKFTQNSLAGAHLGSSEAKGALMHACVDLRLRREAAVNRKRHILDRDYAKSQLNQSLGLMDLCGASQCIRLVCCSDERFVRIVHMAPREVFFFLD